MGKKINLIGQRFGLMTVIGDAPSKNNYAYWTCQCDCGNIKIARGIDLRAGKTVSCGCKRKNNVGKIKDITNQRFGRLTAIKSLYYDENKHCYMWLCKCDCGNELVLSVHDLKRRKSCGCINKERFQEIGKNNAIDITGQKFGKLTVLSQAESKNNNAYWLCECECGNKKIIRGSHLRDGSITSCGCIGKSKGEYKIREILIQNNISFEEQKIFQTCYFKDKNKPLKFDFYIDNKYLLEFDGQQHEYSTSGWNNEEKVELNKKRDKAKNQWCKENNIPLIRIPYSHLNNLCLKDLLLETSQFII